MNLSNILSFLVPALDEVSNGVTLADARQDELPLVFVNQAFERVTGYSATEALGKNCRFLQGDGTDPRAVDKIRQALRDGVACRVCLRNYRKDGTAFLNELKLLPIAGDGAAVDYFIGIQNDVTALLLARALRQNQSSLAMRSSDWQIEYLGFPFSLDAPAVPRYEVDVGVLVADHRGQICYANRSASRLIELAPSAIENTSVFDHFDADWLSETLRSDGRDENEWLTARMVGEVGGESRAELSTYRVLPDPSAKPFYVILLRSLPTVGE